MSVPIIISDLLILFVAGLNPRQGSRKAAGQKSENINANMKQKYQVWNVSKYSILDQEKPMGFSASVKTLPSIASLLCSWTSSVTRVETRYQTSVHCSCQFCFNPLSLSFQYSNTLFCFVTMSIFLFLSSCCIRLSAQSTIHSYHL